MAYSNDPLPPRPRMPTPQEILASLPQWGGAITSNGQTQGAMPGMPSGMPGMSGKSTSNVPPGWAASLFGGSDPLQGGMLQSTQARGLGRDALLQASINLLQNSGPSPYRRGLGELVGTALQAGQGAYQQGAGQVMQQQQTVADRLAASRERALHMRYAGRTDPKSLTEYMTGLIGLGTPNAVRSASAISELLKSQHQAQDPAPQSITGVSGADPRLAALGLDRHKTYTVSQNRQGKIVATLETPAAPSDASARGWESAGRALAGQVYDPFTIKTINTYYQFQSHLAQALAGNPAAYKSVASAFASNTEPNNQLRLGMLQFLMDFDPSVKGRADIALQRLQSGQWPDSLLEGMQKVVEDNFQQVRSRTQDLYDWYSTNDPEAARHIPPPSVRFGNSQHAPAVTPGVGSSGFRFQSKRP